MSGTLNGALDHTHPFAAKEQSANIYTTMCMYPVPIKPPLQSTMKGCQKGLVPVKLCCMRVGSH